MFAALRNNRGSTMVIYAVMATVLLGFSAVALDTGNVMIQRQKLQNAVDAAALAAAQKLPNTSQASAAADRYVELNGFPSSIITVTFSDSNKSVTVKSNKRVEYTFARIFGLDSKVVTTSAKATVSSLGDAFNYVIFSGSKTTSLTLNGSQYDITGSVHTNNSFYANGSSLTITGACEAMGTISVNGSHIDIPNRYPNSSYIGMPDFSETIKLQAQAAGNYYVGNKTFNGSSIDVNEPIYVEGNITINGSGFTGIGCLLATGTITFNGSSQNISTNDAVCIYSKTGSIYINGSSSTVEGILYAPNGSIVMNGSHQTVNGRVIADRVNMNGSDFTITVKGSIDDLKCLPPKYVKLTR